VTRRFSWRSLCAIWSSSAPDPDMRAKVAAAEQAAEDAAAQEESIDRKVDAYVRVMKAHGLTVKDPAALRRRLQAGGGANRTGGPCPARTVVGDRATPNLASRDFAATSAFYARLGFVEQYRDQGWMILARGPVVLEFFPFPDLDPATSAFSSCLRLDDVDSFVQVCADAGVPVGEQGWPRLHLPKLEASGLRIGGLLDPDANLLRLIANG